MIRYNISPFHQMESDIRLADAMVFAALKSALGDRIEAHSSIYEYTDAAPLWGLDHYEDPAILQRRAAAYREPAVLAAIGGTIVPARDAGRAMDALAANSIQPAMRSMADPIERRYFPGLLGHFQGPDGVFERNKDRLRIKSPDEEVCIHAHYDTIAGRRFLIVAGEIAAETPDVHSDEDPARLLDPQSHMFEPVGDFMSDLVPANPEHLELQRAAVETLLRDYPMVSGAIDVGIVVSDGAKRAQIEQVWAAPPGGAYTLFADPVAYAAKIADHLHVLEPDLPDHDTPNP
ncbi:hypothetical protein KUV57_11155 [Epibacterium sp. DP7N7-1]|nr:hypothetical protein [Epibacterium sp. DP7N7-1]